MYKGRLYILPTPIGNIEDITLRVLRLLKEVDGIICEDTRETLKLLNHYKISKPLYSYTSDDLTKKISFFIDLLKRNTNLGLVSERGTPGISDPGTAIVEGCIKENIEVISLPGPSVITTVLAGSGLRFNHFGFLGFLPRKKSKIKKNILNNLEINGACVFFESPYRLLKTLQFLKTFLPIQTKICCGREISKKFEEYIRGDIEEVINVFSSKNKIGEVVVVVKK